MNFVSTRGAEKVSGARAIVQGLAKDGGLFVPEKFPAVSREELEEMLAMDYPERASFVLHKYLDEYDENELLAALKEAYAKFDDGDPAPLVKVENGKVTAVAEGVANIKAESTEDAKVSAVCKVTVTKADALTVKLDAETAKLYTEDKKELKATVAGANGNVTYSFASDKTDIAKVEGSGEK